MTQEWDKTNHACKSFCSMKGISQHESPMVGDTSLANNNKSLPVFGDGIFKIRNDPTTPSVSRLLDFSSSSNGINDTVIILDIRLEALCLFGGLVVYAQTDLRSFSVTKTWHLFLSLSLSLSSLPRTHTVEKLLFVGYDMSKF